jgi:hypothetical protein
MKTNFDILFGAKIHNSNIAALVRVSGDNNDLRIRTGKIESLTSKHVVIHDDKVGYRTARLEDVIHVH